MKKPSISASNAAEILEIEESDSSKPAPGKRRTLIKSATFVMLGNLGSSILGLLRQSTLAALGPDLTGSFTTALTPLQTFLDLLANGTVSGALLPTFTEYSAEQQQQELRRIVYSLINLLLIVSVVVALGFLWLAPWFVGSVLAGDLTAKQKALTIIFSQVMMFALMIMGPFAVLQAVLYARKEFGFTALAAGLLHVGIIIGALLSEWRGATRFGDLCLAFGVPLGALAQIALLIPGLRRQKLAYMLVLDLKHPALRRIFRLYLPLALSYLVSMVFVFLDVALANRTPGDDHAANLTALRLATTLTQFPVGLVSMALSFAVLPVLSSYAAEKDDGQFKETLLIGMRLGLMLMLPATAGLILLRVPITTFIFEHRHYTRHDVALTAVALQYYACQLPFTVIDQLSMFAFYARRNTVVPVIVGIACYGLYLLVALPFYRTVGMPALALANTVQNSMHGIILLIMFLIFFGSLNIKDTWPAILKMLLATAAMCLVVWSLLQLLQSIPFFSLQTFQGQLLTLLITGGAAILVYFGTIMFLKVEEIGLLKQAILAKFGRPV